VVVYESRGRLPADFMKWLTPQIQLGNERNDTQIQVDGTRGCLRACQALKMQNTHLKVILSVGGENGSHNFPTVVADANATERFARTARALIDEWSLDGLDGNFPSRHAFPTKSVNQGYIPDSTRAPSRSTSFEKSSSWTQETSLSVGSLV